jgi:hypothetical protein
MQIGGRLDLSGNVFLNVYMLFFGDMDLSSTAHVMYGENIWVPEPDADVVQTRDVFNYELSGPCHVSTRSPSPLDYQLGTPDTDEDFETHQREFLNGDLTPAQAAGFSWITNCSTLGTHWDSPAGLYNSNGRSFRLYLVPPTGYFGTSGGYCPTVGECLHREREHARSEYFQACENAGLSVVGFGPTPEIQLPNTRPTDQTVKRTCDADSGCVPLPSWDVEGWSNWMDVHAQTQFSNFVMLDANNDRPIADDMDDWAFELADTQRLREKYPKPLHPLCGEEYGKVHSSGLPPPPPNLPPPPPHPLTEEVQGQWSSGSLLNFEGDAYMLYLLPAITFNASDTPEDRCNLDYCRKLIQQYLDACEAVHMRTVALSEFPRAPLACSSYNGVIPPRYELPGHAVGQPCMGVYFDSETGTSNGRNFGRQIISNTAWQDFVVFGEAMGILHSGPPAYDHGAYRSKQFHPLCGVSA